MKTFPFHSRHNYSDLSQLNWGIRRKVLEPTYTAYLSNIGNHVASNHCEMDNQDTVTYIAMIVKRATQWVAPTVTFIYVGMRSFR